jgi:hypothetical protein
MAGMQRAKSGVSRQHQHQQQQGYDDAEDGPELQAVQEVVEGPEEPQALLQSGGEEALQEAVGGPEQGQQPGSLATHEAAGHGGQQEVVAAAGQAAGGSGNDGRRAKPGARGLPSQPTGASARQQGGEASKGIKRQSGPGADQAGASSRLTGAAGAQKAPEEAPEEAPEAEEEAKAKAAEAKKEEVVEVEVEVEVEKGAEKVVKEEEEEATEQQASDAETALPLEDDELMVEQGDMGETAGGVAEEVAG